MRSRDAPLWCASLKSGKSAELLFHIKLWSERHLGAQSGPRNLACMSKTCTKKEKLFAFEVQAEAGTGAQRSGVRFTALGRDAATSCGSPACREGCAEGGETLLINPACHLVLWSCSQCIRETWSWFCVFVFNFITVKA